MKLYSAPISGNAYKVRLFLSLLGLDCEVVDVDPFGEGPLREELRRLNPRGQIPVLVDGERVVRDSQAILAWLARAYAEPSWLPLEAGALARVMEWLAVSENELLFGLAWARAVLRFARPYDLEASQALGRRGLTVLEGRLQEQPWLAADHPTIADIACYPYVALAPEGGLALDDRPAIRAWLARIEALPGYVPMEGIDPAAR
ncbi:MAG: glutathione S-transferase family protein [Gammaproteobacteria bacterium]|nr:MAG: glutathione S-transferase family protein [Gammaproteobacteria bacterium]